MKFQEGYDRLPYIQSAEDKKAFVESVSLNFVQNVRNNYDGFTKRYIKRAVLDHGAAGLIGHPSERDLKYLVSGKLTDCPVTIPDVNNAHKIFGPILCGTKGNTVSQKPTQDENAG